MLLRTNWLVRRKCIYFQTLLIISSIKESSLNKLSFGFNSTYDSKLFRTPRTDMVQIFAFVIPLPRTGWLKTFSFNIHSKSILAKGNVPTRQLIRSFTKQINLDRFFTNNFTKANATAVGSVCQRKSQIIRCINKLRLNRIHIHLWEYIGLSKLFQFPRF